MAEDPVLCRGGDLKMPRTLVTGAGGMVGYAVRKLDYPDTVYLTRNDADLTDFENVKEVFGSIRPDRVIHLAAVVGGVARNTEHPGEFFLKNIQINTNVLEAARLYKVKKLISFMSTCAFPEKCSYPMNEKAIHNGQPHPSSFGYSYAKRMLEVQSSAYRKEWNCDYIVAIPTNIYGPNDNFSLKDGHVIPSLIHKCFLAKNSGSKLEIWGSGEPLREFVLSDDIARLTFWALENYSESSPIIFSSGEEISIKETMRHITKKMGYMGKAFFDSSKPDGQTRKPSDPSKLRKYLPGFKFTPIKTGIEKTIDWFISNYPKIRM